MAKRIFIDLPWDQQVLDHTTFIATVLGEPTEQSPLVKAAKELIDAKKNKDVVQFVLKNLTHLLVPKVPDRDLEAQSNLVLSILFSLPELQSDAAQFVAQFTKIISSAETHASENPKPVVLVKILYNTYNNLDVNSPVRLTVFTALVTLAAKTRRLNIILPQLPNLEGWTKQWGISAEQQRALYLQLHDALAKEGHSTEAYTSLLKLLSTFTDADAASAEAAKSASAAIVQAIVVPGLFNFEDILKLKAVKSLSNSSEYQLLKTLTDGDISGFETIFAAHKATLTASNVDHDKTKKKVQLTALSALAAKHVGAEISYADISKAVSIPADQIEAFVIEAIQAGLVDARLDQLKQVLTVTSAKFRTFDQSHWQELAKKLALWTSSIDGVLEVIQNAKSIAQPV